MRILGLLLGLAVLCSNASATIIVSIGSGTFDPNSGIQTVDIFARATAADKTDFLTADFTLSGGAILGSPAGRFSGADGTYIGEGVLTSFSSFENTSANKRTGSLSLEFSPNGGIQFPTADTLLARLLIDTTGAIGGTYQITVNPQSLAAVGAISATNGSFTITAVPEPTSVALLGVAIGGVFVGRTLRKRKKSLANA